MGEPIGFGDLSSHEQLGEFGESGSKGRGHADQRGDKLSAEKESSATRHRLPYTNCFNALWFCYSPVHQMQQYYRVGMLENCSEKWNVLWDCLYLKNQVLFSTPEKMELHWLAQV
ncbi:hypothetical protein CRYUN_Cryun37aG0024500 [Craigia yunnanensis]